MRRESRRYRADERVAVGATAVLWRGRDLELNRPVAIKRPHPHLVDDEETRARFLREARNAARLSHQNVVQIFDVGIDDEGPWIAMEFAEGQSLAEYLEGSGPLAAVEAARIGAQIAAALSHAHRIPVVHRDVKPGNVIIDGSGAVRLVDFGLARLADDGTLTAAGLIAGTPAYMAPEIIRGNPATPASDVYALGVVLYELLTGAPPFTGDNPLAVALAHDRDDPPPLSAGHAVPPAMERLVTLCMSKDPAKRPTSGALEVGLLEMAGPGDVTHAVTPPGSDEAVTVAGAAVAAGAPRRHRATPKRAYFAVATVSALAIAALGVGMATRGDNSQDLGSPAATPTQSKTDAVPVDGTNPQVEPPVQTQTTAARTGQTAGRSPAASRVAELIVAATSAGAISEGRAATLEKRLRDAEQAILGGDEGAGAEDLAKLARDSRRGRLRDSALAADLGTAIRALATSWGIDLASDEERGNSDPGDGDGDGDG